jgi:hypothetical protein
VATLGCVIAVGMSTLASRVIIIQSEHYSQEALRAEVQQLGSAGLMRLKTVDFEESIRLDTDYGPGWVYLSNVNAVGGGPVWEAFHGLR